MQAKGQNDYKPKFLIHKAKPLNMIIGENESQIDDELEPEAFARLETQQS